MFHTSNNLLIGFQLHFRKLRQRPKDLMTVIHGIQVKIFKTQPLKSVFSAYN